MFLSLRGLWLKGSADELSLVLPVRLVLLVQLVPSALAVPIALVLPVALVALMGLIALVVLVTFVLVLVHVCYFLPLVRSIGLLDPTREFNRQFVFIFFIGFQTFLQNLSFKNYNSEDSWDSASRII